METILLIVLCIICGFFGWWMADVAIVAKAAKETLGHNLPKLQTWKPWVLEIIMIIALFLQGWLINHSYKNRTYYTNKYNVEYVVSETNPADTVSFKIVER